MAGQLFQFTVSEGQSIGIAKLRLILLGSEAAETEPGLHSPKVAKIKASNSRQAMRTAACGRPARAQSVARLLRLQAISLVLIPHHNEAARGFR